MADAADSSKPTERYAAIERAYCADQWGQVIDQGQTLLRELPRTGAPVPEGLKERVQLLMAHAHLYGLHQREVAENLYRDVLHSNAELALRQIAEEGLQQCSPPPQVSAALGETGQAGGRSPGPTAAAPSPVPSPAASQDQRSAPQQAISSQLGGTERESPACTPAADADRAAAVGRETALAPENPGPAASGAATSFDAATIPAPATRTAAATPAAPSPAASGSPAMPWLASGTRTTPDATTAASSAPTPWATAATRPETLLPAPSPEGLKAALAPPPGAVPQEALVPSAQSGASTAQAGALDVTLIPEVVDEPELVEIHQADPLLAEELDLTVLEPEPPVAVTAAEIVELPNTSLAAAAAIASAAILGATAAAAETPTTPARQVQGFGAELEPQAPPGSQRRAAPSQPQDLLSRTRPETAAGPEPDKVCELFRNPPAPLEEEDQELLLGLLQVLVSADSAGDSG